MTVFERLRKCKWTIPPRNNCICPLGTKTVDMYLYLTYGVFTLSGTKTGRHVENVSDYQNSKAHSMIRKYVPDETRHHRKCTLNTDGFSKQKCTWVKGGQHRCLANCVTDGANQNPITILDCQCKLLVS